MSDQKTETIRLEPSKGWVALNIRDLWRFRELAFFFTWRDITVRYKQTLIGALWAILQPLIQMLVWNFLFTELAGVSTENIPPAIFTFSALLMWNLFNKSLGEASQSLVKNRNMITKVYFPKLIVPMASILAGVVDFLIAFLLLIPMMWIYNTPFSANLWYAPVFVLLALMISLGVGLWLSAWNLHYRDVRYLLPLLQQSWMFLTPIAYPLSEIASRYPDAAWLFSLNPMVGVVEGFRWAVAGSGAGPWALVGQSFGISIVVLISGLYYFRRMERTFADMV